MVVVVIAVLWVVIVVVGSGGIVVFCDGQALVRFPDPPKPWHPTHSTNLTLGSFRYPPYGICTTKLPHQLPPFLSISAGRPHLFITLQINSLDILHAYVT